MYKINRSKIDDPDWDWATCVYCGDPATIHAVVMVDDDEGIRNTLAKTGWCSSELCASDMGDTPHLVVEETPGKEPLTEHDLAKLIASQADDGVCREIGNGAGYVITLEAKDMATNAIGLVLEGGSVFLSSIYAPVFVNALLDRKCTVVDPTTIEGIYDRLRFAGVCAPIQAGTFKERP